MVPMGAGVGRTDLSFPRSCERVCMCGVGRRAKIPLSQEAEKVESQKLATNLKFAQVCLEVPILIDIYLRGIPVIKKLQVGGLHFC